eukprot:jgi/Orpsp1_1/1176491/evm.model.c7180000057811.1
MKFIVCASILSAGIFKYVDAACGGAYAQCGGNNFSGETCCESGYKCVELNEWYSQCQADGSATQNSASNNDNNNWNWNNGNNGNGNGWSWGNNDQNQWNNGNSNGWSWGNNDQNQNQNQNQDQNQWNNNNDNNQNQNQNQNPTKTLPEQQQQSQAKTLPAQQSQAKTLPAQQQQSQAKTLPAQQQQSQAKTLPAQQQQQSQAKTLPAQQQQQSQAKTLPAQQQQQSQAKTLPAQQQQQQSQAKTLPAQQQQQSQAKTLPAQQQQQQQQSQAKTLPAQQQQQQNPAKTLPAQQPEQNSSQNAQQSNASGSGSSQNFFQNEIYANPKFIEEVDSSIAKLDGELKAKAEKVKTVPTAVWLAWEGAPAEVEEHLVAAGSKTVVFILYMIPTRDCNSQASAGGASSLETYKGYIDSISKTISSHPSTKVVMVVEPDTLGNLVTGSSEACKTVHTLHKNALSYAVNVFGAMSNVSVYLDAAHGKWLGGVTDKVAAVIKEILSNAPNGKIRGLSTNVSNYQPVASEYQYHQKLASSLAAAGIPDMHFIVDTGRSGVDITESFSKTETWCNFVGTGFGERPKGNPNPSMPLLDAYMWLKTPGEADGSATGSRADPVCARADSLQGAPDAGQWFHEYFVQLLQNANPGF